MKRAISISKDLQKILEKEGRFGETPSDVILRMIRAKKAAIERTVIIRHHKGGGKD